jgi:hypothetical protein
VCTLPACAPDAIESFQGNCSRRAETHIHAVAGRAVAAPTKRYHAMHRHERSLYGSVCQGGADHIVPRTDRVAGSRTAKAHSDERDEIDSERARTRLLRTSPRPERDPSLQRSCNASCWNFRSGESR